MKGLHTRKDLVEWPHSAPYAEHLAMPDNTGPFPEVEGGIRLKAAPQRTLSQRRVHERRRTRPGSTMANFPGNWAISVCWTRKLSSNCVI